MGLGASGVPPGIGGWIDGDCVIDIGGDWHFGYSYGWGVGPGFGVGGSVGRGGGIGIGELPSAPSRAPVMGVYSIYEPWGGTAIIDMPGTFGAGGGRWGPSIGVGGGWGTGYESSGRCGSIRRGFRRLVSWLRHVF